MLHHNICKISANNYKVPFSAIKHIIRIMLTIQETGMDHYAHPHMIIYKEFTI